ncbi:MAG: hypothetical protein A3F94_01015 [Candidatus Spechtbacteria bacterium RIFCSPLOWO2_12_FULL_38_22]|uniref:UMP kinase n=1 Tax=Candidatus Spechtbacteria bacterium RIFCSPLOWO2_12_FULL_38_22 TaxID=1802165 RepID=A0A1G2HI47_9BACT|nr:MAG: hypothetical protein A2728_01555 [Candidatus Spechtbacteria bacterium RIFCSPHIGHO2_01_FULL_38_11]OGZ59859.1 MAG: hypothetical protein A3E58_02115 [Candidatus Spechtbacteria bacterium RIFCSPHIGHO2_12_FULL_38_30]OGZ62147.1 MAG: hypothetical protein A3F94_01015 [Candidatus Spechtbacteria bacterium RIFCSPLOWO2_12_FULL_38_22]
MKNFIVISLGGSIVVSRKIQTDYLKRFYDFIVDQIASGKKFMIIVGGGSTARKYQDAAASVVNVTDEDKDWIGIHSTRLNAHLLRTVFRKFAYPKILTNYNKPIDKRDLEKYALFVASGSRPGWSTDYVAFQLSRRFKAKEVLIATKIPYVYDKDISQHKNARPLKNLTWAQYKKLLPSDTWIPGMRAPVDPIATEFASKNKLRCVLLRGTNIKNLKNYFEGKNFEGTVIK